MSFGMKLFVTVGDTVFCTDTWHVQMKASFTSAHALTMNKF